MKIENGRELQDSVISLLEEMMEKSGLEGRIVTYDEALGNGYPHARPGYGFFVDTEDGVWGISLHRECLPDGEPTSRVVYKTGSTIHLDPEMLGIEKEEEVD